MRSNITTTPLKKKEWLKTFPNCMRARLFHPPFSNVGMSDNQMFDFQAFLHHTRGLKISNLPLAKHTLCLAEGRIFTTDGYLYCNQLRTESCFWNLIYSQEKLYWHQPFTYPLFFGSLLKIVRSPYTCICGRGHVWLMVDQPEEWKGNVLGAHKWSRKYH